MLRCWKSPIYLIVLWALGVSRGETPRGWPVTAARGTLLALLSLCVQSLTARKAGPVVQIQSQVWRCCVTQAYRVRGLMTKEWLGKFS